MEARRKQGITPDEFRTYRDYILRPWRWSIAEPTAQQLGEVGPNGHCIGYTREGDKVEWLSDDAKRNDKTILAAYNEFGGEVLWSRDQDWPYQIQTGEDVLTDEQKPLLETAKKAARRIERKYGRKNLGWDDFNWGLLNGKMSALSWVMGAE